METDPSGMIEIIDNLETTRDVSHGLRLLWIGSEEPSWIGMALRLDAEGLLEPRLRWAATPADALTILREEVFNCILVGDDTSGRFSTATDDPTLLVQAIRGSGFRDSIIFITPNVDDYRSIRLYDLDCDVLVTPNSYDSPALLPFIHRAISHAECRHENQRLSVVHKQRLLRDRSEAEHLLQQQRSIITKLESPFTGPSFEGDTGKTPPHSQLSKLPEGEASVTLPVEMGEFYHELLRTFVMMGSGSLASDIAGFSRLLVAAGVSMRQALQFHLERVESLVRDLGSRSTRHVMARADLLALELMVHLGEEYRQIGQITPALHNLSDDEMPNVE